jgi:hypothetical protein
MQMDFVTNPGAFGMHTKLDFINFYFSFATENNF